MMPIREILWSLLCFLRALCVFAVKVLLGWRKRMNRKGAFEREEQRFLTEDGGAPCFGQIMRATRRHIDE
jgi:hypothetical protein